MANLVSKDGFLKEIRLVDGPFDGRVVQNPSRTPHYVNEAVRFVGVLPGKRRPRRDVEAVYRVQADGTAIYLHD